MKTFIAAIVLLAVATALIISNALFIDGAADKMLALCEKFPSDADGFYERYDEVSAAAEEIFVLWINISRDFPRRSVSTISTESTTRCLIFTRRQKIATGKRSSPPR